MNDLSDKEQLDEMRAWWAEYGRYVVIGLVLGGAIIFGWNQWQASIAKSRTEASILFETVMNAVQDGDIDAAEAAAGTVFADYGQTVYPGQTRLAMARLYMDKGRDQDAAQVLREMLGARESPMQMVARLRLARILLYQNKPDEVVELLEDREAGGFTARYSEVLGDAHAAQGDYAEARAAYVTALGANAKLQTIDADLVQLKLNDLPDPAELAAASEALEAVSDDGEAAAAPEEDEQEPAAAGAVDEPAADAETGE